ncbi:MAG TPA: winged helix-turn-helix domain-containing protein [Solirubrobacterales bacterium]|nr:winged helix-turn-helix domain-containing protein [Solirubrobacterales bacterium]
MTPTWIEIDEDVLAKVKASAEPFIDSPNDALRKLLDLKPTSDSSCAPLPRPKPYRRPGWAPGPRARNGEGLPMAEYELPLLRLLSQLGGSGPRWKVMELAESMLADRLSDVDHGRFRNGEKRWENRLAFARLRAVERGHISSSSRRGIWELTDAGIERLGQLEVEIGKREREVRQ